ncbi:ribonuclease E/G [Clostridium sp.]|uniref:ribonuclease E/G n=1 Tax=Clostridium sp. TaxID=1506 RepID=UPI00261F571E|nr:ribonuclease E/G [Clostridium sp.]
MREILVEREENLLRIAIKDNGVLSEFLYEESSLEPAIGEIYKGKVKNIIPGINSIFIDIGLKKEAYMYYSDDIKEKGIKKGDEVLVEIIKEPLNNKGAKVIKNISIPGKFMVLTKGETEIKFSKRIVKEEDKIRVKNILNKLKGYSITIRTEGANASDLELLKEKEDLFSEMNNLENILKYRLSLGKVYGDNIILSKILRENYNKECKIIFNKEEDLLEVKEKLKSTDIELEMYKGIRGLFDYYGIEKEILKLRHKKVNLNCGGNIVIDKTEAMYVIDINTAKNIKGRNFNKTILETNLEAAKEIGRQIRLRNLSGIIVIDFIDMRDYSQKAIVMEELKKALEEDKGNSKIFPFTELDLIQISRKRIGKSIYEYLEEPCKRCNAEGQVLKLSYIENLINNEIIKGKDENSINSFYIELDKNYEAMVREDIIGFLQSIDGLDKEIYVNYVDGIEGYKVEPIIFNSQKENLVSYKVNE